MSDTRIAAQTRLVVDFGELDSGLLTEVGGKAVNLGILTRAGFPVPPGFCVTTEAYHRIAAAAGVEDILRRTPAKLDEAVRTAILAVDVPADIATAVLDAYAQLGAGTPVAVRSSATAEDLPFASFAGQQDTYLNLVGADAVLDAVRRCWASLWTKRAVSYRITNEIDQQAVALAVVVQRMVDVEAAGVMFTANPVTGKRNEAVIDASPGLGEAVVSGAVNPDHFVVDTPTGRITERSLGDKRVLIRAVAAGGTERIELDASGQTACLTDDQLRELAKLGAEVQRHYDSPQDTEWALDRDGKLWLTQTRPITTLFPVPEKRMPGPEPRLYLCASLAQGLTRPLTPMGLAGIRLLATSVAEVAHLPVPDPLDGPTAYSEGGQRIFIDLTPVIRSSAGRELAPRVLDVMETRSAVVLRQLFDDPRFSVLTESPWRFRRRIAGIALRRGVPQRALRAVLRPASAHRELHHTEARLKALFAGRDSVSPRERLDFVEKILRAELGSIMPQVAPSPGAGFLLLALAQKLLGDLVKPGELQKVLRGLPHNITTEMDLDLWNLTTRIRADQASASAFAGAPVDMLTERYRQGSLPTVAQTELAGFLDQYGHRAVAEIDLGLPRWSEDPAHIIGVVANYLRLTDPELAPAAQFAKGAAAAEETIADLVRRARSRGRLRARVIRFALRRARELAGLCELGKYFLILVLAGARRELVQVGAELAAAGRIDSPDDIFFLDLREVRGALAGDEPQALIDERKVAYEQEVRRRRVPRMLLSDGTEPEALAVARGNVPEGTLVGSAASAGTITSKARVVLDPVGAHLEPGEILVAPSTDPGWTPLFLTAGALVMEMGGANSHGAVVAREYGIPAVVGVPDATSIITTGQLITVDGATGTITPAADGEHLS